MLRLYNTLSKKVEDFKPINPPEVGFYSCGPTVYDFAHIGHARTYVFADILQRVLEFNGYQVKRVMNITDVGHLTSDADTGEDKMEKGARREKKTVWEIAKFYTKDFFQMLDKLNIKRPQIICRATGHIKEMIQLIEILEREGFAYTISDGVYFNTSKFPNYGCLTGQTFSQLQKTLRAGSRIEMVPGKRYPTDFALWKFSYPGGRSFDSAQDDVAKRRQMEWDSPWGKGFPGWHIECSAMSMKHLGETCDIHSGGVDHIPIHHTNEIAQSEAAYRTVHGEAATGKPFVKYWLHGEHLLVEGQKMSKSLNNFYRVSDLEKKGFSPLSLRYLFLTAHYRTQLNFTWKGLSSAQNALRRLQDQIATIKSQMQSKKRVSLSQEKLVKMENLKEEFLEAVNNDLNTATALSLVWEVVKSNIPPTDKYDLLCLFDEVLGLELKTISVTQERIIPLPISKGSLITTIPFLSNATISRIDKREKARVEKDFKKADEIKKQIIDVDKLVVEDTTAGTVVKKI